jgi:hypothetical protein
VETARCPIAPGSAVALTEIRSAREKCSPTAKSSRITPDFGELVGHCLIGHESRCEGADKDVGEQIAD